MSKFIDLTGKRFERLLVIKKLGTNRWRNSYWLCRCDCGKEKIILGYNLKNGHTQSCGCLFKEGNNTKHGHSTTIKVSKTYEAWAHIIQRCTNPNNKDYYNYGGRGIKVCKRWLKFENFLKDMGEAPEAHQIDRINNNGNYCKSNCRWTTSKINNRNRRDNRLITHEGEKQCLAAWAEEYQIDYRLLWQRIYRDKWSIEKALTTPTRKRKRRKNK